MNHQKNAETKNNKKSDSVSFNTAPRINKSRFEKLNKVKTIETKINIKDLPASLKDKKLSEFGKFNDVIDFIRETTISKKLPNSNESESLDLKIDCLSENAKNIIEKCKLVNDLIKISSLKNDKSKSEDMPCIHRKTENDSENENSNNDSENENINNDLSIPVTLLLNKIDISHPNDDSSEESSEDSEISEDYENLIKKKDLPYIYGGLVGNIYKQSFNRKNKNNLIDDIEKTKLLIEELNKKLTEPKKESKKPFICRCISYLIRLGSKNKENNDSTESINSLDLSEESSESTSETTSETTESSEDSSKSTSETTSEDTESSEDSSETTENQEVEDEYGESSVINKLIDWKKKFNKSIDAIKLINSKLPNKYKGFIVGMLTTLIISKIYKN